MTLRRTMLLCSVLLVILAVPAFGKLKLPADFTVEATQPGGAIVDYSAGVEGGGEDENGRPLVSAVCSPAPRSLFPLGKTTVHCSGGDGSQGSFSITVVDSGAPQLNLPRDFSLSTENENGAVVTFDASASDTIDGPVPVTCSPASGSLFPIGTTRVTCTASDSQGNSANGSFEITVVRQTTTPPPPPPVTVTVEATGPGGAIVTFTSTGGGPDDFNGRPSGACSAASGSLFPLGTTIVYCSDFTLTINVVDTTPPALSLPGNITRPAAGPNGTVVTFDATANDLVDGSVAVTCTPASGSTFAPGTTTVGCSASDSRSNSATGSFNVEVSSNASDTTPPVFLSISASPNTLNPPNKQMVPVTVTASVQDDTDPIPLVRIFSITANETITSADYQITGLLTVNLRADRDGNGDGRTYTIHVEAIDASGNRSVATTTVTVPHDQGNSSTVTVPEPATTTPAPTPKRRSARG